MSDLTQLFGRAVNKLRDNSLEQGTLGVHRPDTTVDMTVTGRPGWLHVTLNGQTPVKAYNKAGVPQTTDLQVDMRVVNGRRVIVGVSGDTNLSVPVPIPPSGVWPHTLGSHSDVTETSPAAGDVLAHNGTDWVDETPIATSTGAGDAGKLIRTDAGGQVDATMIAAEDIAAKIDGATVSASMSTTDKIAAVISGALRYFTYQTIRDAITSYISSVAQTFTNKTIDASANTLTNINTSALADDAVSNAKAANMAQQTVKGRAVGAGTGDPTDLTPEQVRAILNAAVADATINGDLTVEDQVIANGDGVNAHQFINNPGVAASTLHEISKFYRISSGAGNAGFMAGYYANGTSAIYTVLYAPGALPIAIATFDGGVSTKLYIKQTGEAIFGDNLTTFGASRLGVQAGDSTNDAAVGGVLYRDHAQHANVSTTETTVVTYAIPANTLSANGQALEIRAWGTLANATGGTIQAVRAYFGAAGTRNFFDSSLGTTIWHNNSGETVIWEFYGKIIRTGATSQKGFGRMSAPNSGASGKQWADKELSLNQTLSGAVTFTLTLHADAGSDKLFVEECDIKWVDMNT